LLITIIYLISNPVEYFLFLLTILNPVP